MGDPQVWELATAERLALADDLAGLRDDLWRRQSLCAGWDVRTVVGHLAAALDPSPRPLLAALLRSGGRLHRANDRLARTTAQQPTDRLVAVLRERAGSRSAPPVIGPRGPLTDVVVHAGDVRLPLGLAHDPAEDAVRAGLGFLVDGRPAGFAPRSRLRGLRLVAEDLGGAWGRGAVVSGQGTDLLMAACGRAAVLPHLGGEGAAVLARRLGAEHGT